MSIGKMIVIRLVNAFVLLALVNGDGILYHQDNEIRQSISLNGLWNFKFSPDDVENLAVKKVPVPASYNDIGTDFVFRDHVGEVYYDREFFVPSNWASRRVWIRFSSVCYAAVVTINGQTVISRQVGDLPFQADITGMLNFDGPNTINVVVDNTLTQTTVPQGSLETLNDGRIQQNLQFDFFNYAGIDRPVTIYTTPRTYIDDISVSSDVNGGNVGVVNFNFQTKGGDNVTTKITLYERNGTLVEAIDDVKQGHFLVTNPNWWWPYLMDPEPGYLYTLQVELLDSSGATVDVYRLRIGIRKITWDSDGLYINSRKVYLRGFGRHEDSDFRGKGLDLPLIIRDHHLIKWIGANAYRTSHYPYAEEIMDMADELGIMIIDECPAVGLSVFSDELWTNHAQSLTEMVQRDKNRASVIMWSIANEPGSNDANYGDYMKRMFDHIHGLDGSRPATLVSAADPNHDQALPYVDVCLFNLYRGWYQNTGNLDTILSDLLDMAQRYHQFSNASVAIAEYGADTQEGLHLLPVYVWSEDYQTQLLSTHFRGFDQLRQMGWFTGEMVWNFADFKTAQSTTRVGGNKKGIFTRDRQPKAAAHLMRKRYWALAKTLDKIQVPDDVYDYYAEDTCDYF